MSRSIVAITAVAVFAIGCGPDGNTRAPTEVRVPLIAVTSRADFNLGTHLTGNEEVLAVPPGAPTPADSKAQGEAIFRISDDGSIVGIGACPCGGEHGFLLTPLD